MKLMKEWIIPDRASLMDLLASGKVLGALVDIKELKPGYRVRDYEKSPPRSRRRWSIRHCPDCDRKLHWVHYLQANKELKTRDDLRAIWNDTRVDLRCCGCQNVLVDFLAPGVHAGVAGAGVPGSSKGVLRPTTKRM